MRCNRKIKRQRRFLASKAWAEIKADMYALRGEKCELCKSKRKLQVHHRSYERYGGNEEPEDLIILCEYHHLLQHGRVTPRREDRPKKRKAKKPDVRTAGRRRERWQIEQARLSGPVKIIKPC